MLDPPASSADLAGPPHLDEDYLVLSTVHSAKGLEWDAVHLIGAYDGNFPADMSTGERGGHRRGAAPVLRRADARAPAAARVRPASLLPPRAGRDDAHGYGQASRFLTDAGAGLFTVTRTPRRPPRRRRRGAARPRIEVSVDALFG